MSGYHYDELLDEFARSSVLIHKNCIINQYILIFIIVYNKILKHFKIRHINIVEIAYCKTPKYQNA